MKSIDTVASGSENTTAKGRIIARLAARELAQHEIDTVNGGSGSASYCGGGGTPSGTHLDDGELFYLLF